MVLLTELNHRLISLNDTHELQCDHKSRNYSDNLICVLSISYHGLSENNESYSVTGPLFSSLFNE